jgi:pimeloyl-ACP methyl ester carboxylesterase
VCRVKALDLAFLADSLSALAAGDTPVADRAPGADRAPVAGGADDLLAGRLDLNRLSAAGHSFGGAAALHWCRDDPRCTAAVNLDGALWTEASRGAPARPVLQILAPHPEFDVTPGQAVAAGIAPDPEWFAAERSITVDGWKAVGRTACTVRVTGASHVSFMDVPFLPLADGSPVRPLVEATAVDPARALAVTTALMVAFLSGGDLAPVLESDAVAVVSGR